MRVNDYHYPIRLDKYLPIEYFNECYFCPTKRTCFNQLHSFSSIECVASNNWMNPVRTLESILMIAFRVLWRHSTNVLNRKKTFNYFQIEIERMVDNISVVFVCEWLTKWVNERTMCKVTSVKVSCSIQFTMSILCGQRTKAFTAPFYCHWINV